MLWLRGYTLKNFNILMELKLAQINSFMELNKNCAAFNNLSEDKKREIANGVANYYLTLFSIQQRVKKEGKKLIEIKGIYNE